MFGSSEDRARQLAARTRRNRVSSSGSEQSRNTLNGDWVPPPRRSVSTSQGYPYSIGSFGLPLSECTPSYTSILDLVKEPPPPLWSSSSSRNDHCSSHRDPPVSLSQNGQTSPNLNVLAEAASLMQPHAHDNSTYQSSGILMARTINANAPTIWTPIASSDRSLYKLRHKLQPLTESKPPIDENNQSVFLGPVSFHDDLHTASGCTLKAEELPSGLWSLCNVDVPSPTVLKVQTAIVTPSTVWATHSP